MKCLSRSRCGKPRRIIRSSSKILRCASYFQLSSRCFIWWWNTASHVWYITSTLSCRRLIRWNKKAFLYKVILTLRWCIENNNIKFSVIVDCEIYWEYRTASHLLFWNPWPVTGHIATAKNFTRKLRYKLKKITLSLHGLHSLQSAVRSLHGLRFNSFLNPNH